MIVIGVLAVAMAATWVVVAMSGSEESTGCPTPALLAEGESAGLVLSATALDDSTVAPPAVSRIQVLNAGGSYGQGTRVAADLEGWGFQSAAAPANDPRFPEFDMDCDAQIRFGAAGEQTARTLSLVAPCAELVRLDRPDDVVDLSLGTDFSGLTPNAAALSVLTDLSRAGSGPPNIAAEQLETARAVRC